MSFKLTSKLILVAILLCGGLTGCNSDEPKVRPSAVPASAVWAGGADGGAYIDCTPSQKGEPNACTVYNDGTGDVWMSGGFVLLSQRGASAAQLRYSGADGESILLQDNLVLSPTPTPRPASVPKSSVLAENGVYADCHAEGSDLYQCSLFLAADGKKMASGTYRCNSSLAPCRGPIKPKIADRDTIDLQDGGALEAINNH